MLHVAICEDELRVGTQLEQYLYHQAKAKGIKINIEVFASAEECLAYMKTDKTFHLMFLDIELGEMNGIELADWVRNELKNDDMQIVYISAKESYAMELFDSHPLNFLVKPIKEEKIGKVLDKTLKILGNEPKKFVYKKGAQQRIELLKDILYFEVKNREIVICTEKNKDVFYGTLKDVSEKLNGSNFFLCHRSFLVNYDKVKIFQPASLIMENNDVLPISQSQRKMVKELQLRLEMGDL